MHNVIFDQSDAGPDVLARLSMRKTSQFVVGFFRHLRDLRPLFLARPGSHLQRVVMARPEIFGIVISPYIAANWDVPTRIARFVDHCRTVDDIGGILDVRPGKIVDLIRLPAIDPRYRITLDQARWLLREGPLVLSLWDGRHRIFHLSFALSTEGDRRIAYVGSIQGRREVDMYNTWVDVHEYYRHFTKAAHGMRPRDFLVEMFKAVCRAIEVREIRAVADGNHPQRQIVNDVRMSYNEIWQERGGHRNGNGFFILPVAATRRARSQVPARKRPMYAKRYAMLEAIETELAAVLRGQESTAR